jgi:hypothetical protein
MTICDYHKDHLTGPFLLPFCAGETCDCFSGRGGPREAGTYPLNPRFLNRNHDSIAMTVTALLLNQSHDGRVTLFSPRHWRQCGSLPGTSIASLSADSRSAVLEPGAHRCRSAIGVY